MIDLTPAKFGRKVARRIGQKTCTKACRLCAISLPHLRPAALERKCPASAHSGGGGEQEKSALTPVCARCEYECVRPRCDAGASGHLFIFTFLRTRSLGLWSEPDLTQTNSLTRRPCLLINLIGSRALIDEFN
jgi:hypothetical protein